MASEPMPVFVFGCLSCGKTVSGTEKSCPRCGASFEDVKFECPFCGELVSPSDRVCPSCETEFGAFSEDVMESSTVELDGETRSVQEPESSREAEAAASGLEFECPACGKQVAESDTKCPHCGALFSEPGS
ncbi:MAG TPA: zinc ribbon domain-containing protein [Thermoplasmata archaeon]